MYWKPVWHMLEAEPTWELLLTNAQHVKNLPRRKTDVADAIWLCQLLECGLLRGSFIPPRPVQQLRDLTAIARSSSRNAPGRSSGSRSCWRDAGIKLAGWCRTCSASPPERCWRH